jgi:hypothetical protein
LAVKHDRDDQDHDRPGKGLEQGGDEPKHCHLRTIVHEPVYK